jgi:hypothetical protein
LREPEKATYFDFKEIVPYKADPIPPEPEPQNT